MTELKASRTLVKSPPELWAECSDAVSLTRHLDQFGEIRITRLEPETAVAWEGEHASGTVRLEPSGWGTRVVLTARVPADAGRGPEAAPDDSWQPGPETTAEAEPEAPTTAEPEPRPPAGSGGDPRPRGLMARMLALFRRRRPSSAGLDASRDTLSAPVEVEGEAAGPGSSAAAPGTEAALTAALDSLGQAHHRPFSRA
jgi:hypothetical protein